MKRMPTLHIERMGPEKGPRVFEMEDRWIMANAEYDAYHALVTDKSSESLLNEICPGAWFFGDALLCRLVMRASCFTDTTKDSLSLRNLQKLFRSFPDGFRRDLETAVERAYNRDGIRSWRNHVFAHAPLPDIKTAPFVPIKGEILKEISRLLDDVHDVITIIRSYYDSNTSDPAKRFGHLCSPNPTQSGKWGMFVSPRKRFHVQGTPWTKGMLNRIRNLVACCQNVNGLLQEKGDRWRDRTISVDADSNLEIDMIVGKYEPQQMMHVRRRKDFQSPDPALSPPESSRRSRSSYRRSAPDG